VGNAQSGAELGPKGPPVKKKARKWNKSSLYRLANCRDDVVNRRNGRNSYILRLIALQKQGMKEREMQQNQVVDNNAQRQAVHQQLVQRAARHQATLDPPANHHNAFKNQ
jgi:hypothetical protein